MAIPTRKVTDKVKYFIVSDTSGIPEEYISTRTSTNGETLCEALYDASGTYTISGSVRVYNDIGSDYTLYDDQQIKAILQSEEWRRDLP